MAGDYAQRPKVKRFHWKQTGANRSIRKAMVVRRGPVKTNQRALRPQRTLRSY